jgi:hypothetical protein|tara:strand:+ start:55 stop:333 length:279 start_codon:yes stop_codon:yes gene_type:complete
MSKMYGPEEKAKLERLIKEGSNVLREVEDLNEGLKDTVKAVAEELQIKPSVINKAIKIAHKDDWAKHLEEWEDIEGILGITNNLPAGNTGGE